MISLFMGVCGLAGGERGDIRVHEDIGRDKAVVVLNFYRSGQVFQRPCVSGKLILLVSNVDGVDGTEEKLQGYEGRIYLVQLRGLGQRLSFSMFLQTLVLAYSLRITALL